MWFWNSNKQKQKQKKSAIVTERLENGELPWGWVTRNKEFCEKINEEYTYFSEAWLQARRKSPSEHYSALKSFVVYLEDVEKLCKSKGECFDFWFHKILTSTGYTEKRRKELEELAAIIKK